MDEATCTNCGRIFDEHRYSQGAHGEDLLECPGEDENLCDCCDQLGAGVQSGGFWICESCQAA